jgi:hypothetical protein
MTKIEEYRGHEIHLELGDEEDIYKAYKRTEEGKELMADDTNRQKLKKKIDRLIKRKRNFPIDAIVVIGTYPHSGRITSSKEITSRYGSAGLEFWFSYDTPKKSSWSYGSSTKREKKSYNRSTLYRKTPENLARIARITDLKAQVKALENEIEQVIESFTDEILREELTG